METRHHDANILRCENIRLAKIEILGLSLAPRINSSSRCIAQNLQSSCPPTHVECLLYH